MREADLVFGALRVAPLQFVEMWRRGGLDLGDDGKGVIVEARFGEVVEHPLDRAGRGRKVDDRGVVARRLVGDDVIGVRVVERVEHALA
ncbi:hypothetical protein [Halococcus agarilyticus]|uniref:hypothetical protein n=1 Tax=Halococcus agarilyticus TaxID=1232219 RepID=UPI001E63AE60|nr:hypothetical protein [Halococcus agarilyticus]